MMTVFTIVALPSMAAWQLAAGVQEPDGSIASFARTMLHTLTAVIGTELNSARPPLACLESEVQQTRIEAVSAG
jgi:hypothetical protein